MKQLFIKNLLIVVLVLVFQAGNLANAIENNKNSTLFKIGRSKDANEIYYKVRTTKDGSLDLSDPIQIYWIKFTKNGIVKPLTRVQDNFAYGLKFLSKTPEKIEFQFVSYSKRTLVLRKTQYGNFRVFTRIEGKEVELERVFIQIDGGSFWFPKISRVELYAKVPEKGESVVEIINP